MKEKKNNLIILAWTMCIVSLTIMAFSLLLCGKKIEAPLFVPPEFDQAAVQGVPDVPEGSGWSEVDAQAFKASICGVVTIKNNKADIWFTNPDSNTVWLKLRILDTNGNTLGETGLIKPGEYVQSVTLTAIPDIGESIGLKLMAYEPETYYSAGSATLTTNIAGGNRK